MNAKPDITLSRPAYEDLISYDQVAEDLGVSKETVRHWAKIGKYSVYRQDGGRKPYLDKREIQASFRCEGKRRLGV